MQHTKRNVSGAGASSALTKQSNISRKKKKPQQKPKVTGEQLKAVIYAVFSEADDDGNGDLDINECRSFCKKLMGNTYPAEAWDEERYKQGFYSIDIDKGGSIDFEELYKIIYNNAKRQGMIVGS